jgi:hypothetical protein
MRRLVLTALSIALGTGIAWSVWAYSTAEPGSHFLGIPLGPGGKPAPAIGDPLAIVGDRIAGDWQLVPFDGRLSHSASGGYWARTGRAVTPDGREYDFELRAWDGGTWWVHRFEEGRQ